MHATPVVKQAQVAIAELDDYRNFLKNLQNDVNQYVQTTHASADGGVTVRSGADIVRDERNLPDSSSARANHLDAEGQKAAGQKDFASAEKKFQKAVEEDPKFTRAWLNLARTLMNQMQYETALDAMRKAVDTDPKNLWPRKLYGSTLVTLRRYEAAIQVWKDVLGLTPDDLYALNQVAWALMQQRRFDEAVPYAEAAAKKEASEPEEVRLGTVYSKAGQKDKALAVWQKVLESDSKPDTLNDISYEMADLKVDVPKAIEYAQRAVNDQERASQDVSLSSLLDSDLACTAKIGMFWDTLGWAEFRAGDLSKAEEYLKASWLLTQDAIVGDHLGQVYEAEKKKAEAIHMYRLALASPDGRAAAGDDPKNHLEHLGVKPYSALVPIPRGEEGGGEELSHMRTIKLKKLIPGTASAEFFLLLNHTSKVEEASFISGSEELRSATDALEDLDLQLTFPRGSSAKLVRRGILMCSKLSGCNLVLMTPASVHSVK